MKRRSTSNKTNHPDELFVSLVQNAIDFLQMSVQELEKRPKYSVIHFAMSVELFLKARLLREHWSLVVSKVDRASLQEFRNGEFISVTMDECLHRLKGVAGETLRDHESKCFQAIRAHRNKLVHFFHSDYLPKTDKTLLTQIVLEQLKAWFYLHRLLTERWESHFSPYVKKINRFQKVLGKDRRRFLTGKFEALVPEIDDARKKGQQFDRCRICSFESAKIKPIHRSLFSRRCLVCDWSFNFLEVACPKCEKEIIVEAEDGGECGDCELTIGPNDLMAMFGPNDRPDEESTVAYCSSCENFEASAIPFGDEQYLCLNCLNLHNEVGSCGWCGDLITGGTDGTSIWGCFRCDGPDLKD